MNTVVFDKIETDLKPRQYYKNIEKLVPDKLIKALPGEYVVFSNPDQKIITFTYLGEKPEKFEVKKDGIKVLMTKSLLLLIYKENMGGHARMEVASAL